MNSGTRANPARVRGEILAHNDAVQYVCCEQYFSGVPIRSTNRSVIRVHLKTESGVKVRMDLLLSASGMSKIGIQAALCHSHGYLHKFSKQHDLTVRGDSYSSLLKN